MKISPIQFVNHLINDLNGELTPEGQIVILDTHREQVLRLGDNCTEYVNDLDCPKIRRKLADGKLHLSSFNITISDNGKFSVYRKHY